MLHLFGKRKKVNPQEDLQKQYDDLLGKYNNLHEWSNHLTDKYVNEIRSRIHFEKSIDEKRELILKLQKRIADMEEELIEKNAIILEMKDEQHRRHEYDLQIHDHGVKQDGYTGSGKEPG